MKKVFISLIAIVFLGAFNFSKNECSDKSMQKVHDTLEKMAIENLKAWEPPFNEEKFLSFFTKVNKSINYPSIVRTHLCA